MTSEIDLERKTENALAARLKQHPALKKLRIRRNSEDSPKVNLDLVLSAKRGQQDPPYSGIFEMDITATFTAAYRRTVETLPQFLAICAAIEEVICGVETYTLAKQVSLCTPDFHCYEITVIGKDDTPDDSSATKKHSCIWSLTALAMPQAYATASKVNPNI